MVGSRTPYLSLALAASYFRRLGRGLLAAGAGAGRRVPVRTRYEEAYARSVASPELFWAEAAELLDWHKRWTQVMDDSDPPFTRWFVGGELNTCHNALDRHVERGRKDRVAVIHDSPIIGIKQKITYGQLLDDVKQLSGVLRKHGVKAGDVVLIYMPMIPQAMVAMLASARIGAIHSLVFGGFGAKELSTRIQHAEPKVIISANYGVEPTRNIAYKPLLDEALNRIDFKPKKCIIYNRPEMQNVELVKDRDICYNEELYSVQPADCVPVLATDPIYVLYTSGTTGLPKAVVRPSGGHAVALNWSIRNVYGVEPDEVWWAASDLGWVVGHSFITYGPLINGSTTVLFEGKPVGTPDPGTYFRIIKEHRVAAMFAAPTALRAIRKEDPDGVYGKRHMPFDKFKALFVAGEHCDPETMHWAQDAIQKPILDNWWQTETSWPITSTCYGLGMPLNPPPGVAGKPVPGWNVKILNESGQEETRPDTLGQIVIKLPLPPGSFSTLWKNDEKFKETYFVKYPGYYDTMDSGFKNSEGYIAVMSRSDDVINVAGHRLSTGAIEEAILEVIDIAEAAVIGIPDHVKGQVPLGLCVLNSGTTKGSAEIAKDVIQAVRSHIGPVASFKNVIIVPGLPKTRSGKIARSTIAALAAGKPFQIPVTIDDPSVYLPIKKALQKIGYAIEK